MLYYDDLNVVLSVNIYALNDVYIRKYRILTDQMVYRMLWVYAN